MSEQSVNSKQLAVSSWKAVPHLFANGKFKAKCEIEGDETWTITGFKQMIGSGNVYLTIEDKDNYEVETPVKSCTLIARPISDISDEEVKNCPTYKRDDITPIEEMRYRLWYWTYSPAGLMPAIVQNYLLSIGVYPFGQSHFESGEVIARYENE